MSVLVMPHNSSRRYQSALFLARRETSSPRTMPTRASATSLVRRANPARGSRPEPESPRSSSMTTNLLLGPTELASAVGQRVLAGGGLPIVFDLTWGRL